MQSEVFKIPIEEFYEAATPYMEVMNGLDRDTAGARKSREKAMRIRSALFDGMTMDVLLAEFSRECVEEEAFVFEGTKIPCADLSCIEKDIIKGGYIYMFHAPMPDLSAFPVSKQYMADSWQTAFVDEGRNVLRERILKRAESKYEGNCYITDTIAPGVFGMEGTACRYFFEFLETERIGMEILKSGLMKPLKSFVGIFLILDREGIKKTADCRACLSGGKNCMYCKNYAEKLWAGKEKY